MVPDVFLAGQNRRTDIAQWSDRGAACCCTATRLTPFRSGAERNVTHSTSSGETRPRALNAKECLRPPFHLEGRGSKAINAIRHDMTLLVPWLHVDLMPCALAQPKREQCMVDDGGDEEGANPGGCLIRPTARRCATRESTGEWTWPRGLSLTRALTPKYILLFFCRPWLSPLCHTGCTRQQG